MQKDLNLVRIVSLITFDGHLYKDLSGFYVSSKEENILKEVEKLIERKLKIKGKFYLNDGGEGKIKTHKYRVFNKKICETLEKAGVPKGNKIKSGFVIPDWINKNKKFSKEFVKIAYFCEGSMKEKDRKTPRIKFNMNKSSELLEEGKNFVENIRRIIENYGIRTIPLSIYDKKTNKDGTKIKEIRFRIKTEDNNKFIKHFAPFFIGDYKKSLFEVMG